MGKNNTEVGGKAGHEIFIKADLKVNGNVQQGYIA